MKPPTACSEPTSFHNLLPNFEWIKPGKLAITTKRLLFIPDEDQHNKIQCFPGNLDREIWIHCPHRLYVCQYTREGLISQIIDVVETGMLKAASSVKKWTMVKVLVVIDGEPTFFWVFADDLCQLENR